MRSASNGGYGAQPDIAATAAQPTQRSSTRLTQPAGLEPPSGRYSLRESGSGIGTIARRSASLQYGMTVQPARNSGSSGAWRESLRAGGSGTGATPPGMERSGSERPSSVNPGAGNSSRAESLQQATPVQPDRASVPSGAWPESLQGDAEGTTRVMPTDSADMTQSEYELNHYSRGEGGEYARHLTKVTNDNYLAFMKELGKSVRMFDDDPPKEATPAPATNHYDSDINYSIKPGGKW